MIYPAVEVFADFSRAYLAGGVLLLPAFELAL